MVITIINVDVFERAYRSGLLFSLFEGLKEGESFKIVSKKDLDEIKDQLLMAQVQNMNLEERESSQDLHAVEVRKIGTCGLCGCFGI